MINKLKKIKEQRLSEEEKMFFSLLDNLSSYSYTLYPNRLFYKKENEVYIEIDLNNEIIWVSDKNVISVIFKKFGDIIYIFKIIKNNTGDYYGYSNYKVNFGFSPKQSEWEEIKEWVG